MLLEPPARGERRPASGRRVVATVEHGCAAHAAGAQVVQRLVRLGKPVRLDFHAQRDARCQLQKLEPVGTGEVGHRAETALAPQPGVGKGGDLAHVDACANHGAALAYRAQGGRHERAHGSKDERSVQACRGRELAGCGAGAAQLERQGLRRRVTRTRERVNLAPLPHGDLGDEMRRGTEAKDAQHPGIARHAQRAPADQPGAQQGCCAQVVQALGQRQREVRLGEQQVGVATQARVARELGGIAQVLAAAGAVGTASAGRAEPRHAYALPQAQPLHVRADGNDAADGLMAQHERQARVGQISIGHVQVGAAHAAGRYAQQHLARARAGHFQRAGAQDATRRIQPQCATQVAALVRVHVREPPARRRPRAAGWPGPVAAPCGRA